MISLVNHIQFDLNNGLYQFLWYSIYKVYLLADWLPNSVKLSSFIQETIILENHWWNSSLYWWLA